MAVYSFLPASPPWGPRHRPLPPTRSRRARTLRTLEKRRGAAVVEFALVSVVVAFLVLGMVEISRGLMVAEVLSNAAKSGARTGARSAATNAQVSADVAAVLADHKLSAADAAVTIQVTRADGTTTTDVSLARRYDRVSVRVSLPASKVFWSANVLFGAANVASPPVVMMRQN